MKRELKELLSFLGTVEIYKDEIDGEALKGARAELREYYENHALAFLQTLGLLKEMLSVRGSPKILELGSAPYFFTALLKTYFNCEVTGVNIQAGAWPGAQPKINRGIVQLRVREDKGLLDIDVHVFNVEKDPFPFPDDAFDLVLCMEVIEHLGYSPTHMLVETHRVLRKGGRLLVTVPNAINIKHTINLLLNRSIEFPYSGYGIYGRHQREYTLSELKALLEACHYHVTLLKTANVWLGLRKPWIKRLGNALLNALTVLPLPYLAAKREYILAVAEPWGEPKAAYPDFLYVHKHLYPPIGESRGIVRENS